MIDTDQHEGGRGAEPRGFLDGFGQRCHKMGAIELAGQRIVPRQPHELLVAGVALIVEANNALHARRLAVGAGKPAAGFLDPEHRGGRTDPHAIFDPVGDAVATMRGRRMAQCVRADRTHRLDQFCEFRAACPHCRRDIRKSRGGLITPDDGVGCDVPHEGCLAERGEDGRNARKGGCQNRLV